MMVIFVSQCEKNALKKTRKVLDAFADRIGDSTWQTVITEDGLIAVKNLLRKTASKNTAVACHWLRSRSRRELAWIVGNRSRFNADGVVAVNSTQKKHNHSEWENDWVYLSVIKALVAMAALLHDWGKATTLFQKKLKFNSKESDPIRHEWISCLLLNALVFVGGNTDEGWLNLLSNAEIDEGQIKKFLNNKDHKRLENLPLIAQLVEWLILTHHRLPNLKKSDSENYADQRCETLQAMLSTIKINWGYENKGDNKACFEFPEGLLSQSLLWMRQLKRWAGKLLELQDKFQEILSNGAYRVVLHHARLCLMLGDHYYSSCDRDRDWKSSVELFANTSSQGKGQGNEPKQKLDEHLVHVSHHALQVSQALSRFEVAMESAYDIKKLKQKSPKGYEWQDKAVDKIAKFKEQNKTLQNKGHGWFVVNMASTGCGKTIANAKIMRALSIDGESLRFILALGLRTLTLQTGDEYRDRIGLGKNELAVLVGSSAIQDLHHNSQNTKIKDKVETSYEESGSESLEGLLEEYLDYEDSPTAEFLDVIFPKNNIKMAEKNKAFLYKPVLACTIDHIIAATETIRGGKYILPCLRLLSSDLVIDEVDDFDGKDLIAIGRLIHLAGMLGRKVMISSATIPPDLARGFFNVYQEGWGLHCSFKEANPQIACAWVDEFNTNIHVIEKNDSINRCHFYKDFHDQFVNNRVSNLLKKPVKCKAYIVCCDELLMDKNNESAAQEKYFEKIKNSVFELHSKNHMLDKQTGKKISFGIIRVANIPPCVALTKFLLQTNWREDITPKIMAYHGRQVLLLRHQQEKHLDVVLKRKEKFEQNTYEFRNPIIRAHIDSAKNDHVVFILVATPIEEVGRDHDFDWAIIEPSSYRSIIQLAGRVRRHRSVEADISEFNIGIMQYNLKEFRSPGGPVYCRPGYENRKSLKLITHDLCQLVDEEELKKSINAIPRIQASIDLNSTKKLIDLEHMAIHKSLTNYAATGPASLQAWLKEAWWLTAVPQQMNRFRESRPDISLYLIWMDDKPVFCEKNEKGEFIPREKINNIYPDKFCITGCQDRLWLERDYMKALLEIDSDEESLALNSKRFGEINLPADWGGKFYYSDQLGLFYES